jgi:hypothetical protein
VCLWPIFLEPNNNNNTTTQSPSCPTTPRRLLPLLRPVQPRHISIPLAIPTACPFTFALPTTSSLNHLSFACVSEESCPWSPRLVCLSGIPCCEPGIPSPHIDCSLVFAARWSSNLVHRYNFRLLTTHAGIPPDVWLGLFRFRSTISLDSARKDSIYPGSSCINDNVISITSQLRHRIRQTLSRGLVDVSHPQDSSTGASGYTWWSTFRLEPGFSSLDSSNNTTIRPGLELITLNIN